MMIADRFQAMAALRGWSAEKMAAVLLDYIVRQDEDAAFLAFVARQEAHPAMTRADEFLWTVADRLQRPALTLAPSFQLFCLDTFDLFTPEEAGAEWQRRTAVRHHSFKETCRDTDLGSRSTQPAGSRPRRAGNARRSR